MKKGTLKRICIVLLCLLMTSVGPLAVVASSSTVFFSPTVRLFQENQGPDQGDGDPGNLPDGPDGENLPEEDPLPETYTVTFMAHGAVYAEETVVENTLVPWPANPAPEEGGAPFVTWYAEGTDIPFSPRQVIQADITLVAQFGENHIVTFFDTDGAELEIHELAPGTPVPEPTAEVTLAMGEVVSYWYEEGTPDVPFALGEETDRDLSLHPSLGTRALAVFITNSVEVEPQAGEKGFTARPPEEIDSSLKLEREGYTFSHWSDSKDGTSPFDFEGTPIHDVFYIYAIWIPTPVKYSINFWCDKPASTSSHFAPGHPSNPANLSNYEFLYSHDMPSAPAGTSIVVTEANANNYYKSGGKNVTEILDYAKFVWSETKELSGTGTTVINVYYERVEYIFTFDLAKDHASKKSITDAEMSLPSGKTFTSSDPSYVVKAKLGQYVNDVWPNGVRRTETDNSYFVAWNGLYGNNQQTLTLWTVQYAMNGGKTGRPNNSTATLQVPWKPAPYTETRHYYLENLEGNEEGVAYAPPGYTADPKTRYYTLGRISPPNRQQTNPNSSGGAPKWPGTSILGFEMITTDLTKYFQVVKAQAGSTVDYDLIYYMRRNSYKLTLRPEGGTFEGGHEGFTTISNGLERVLQYEAPLNLPPAPSKANHRFVGWYMDENYMLPLDTSIMPPRNMVLYALYEGTECTVNYYDGSTLIKSNTYSRNAPLTSHKLGGTPYADYVVGSEVPGKGEFLGWYYAVGDGATVLFPIDSQITKDTYNLYAQWKPIQYTVHYEGVEDGRQQTYGDRLVRSGARNTVALSGGLSPRPTRTGYTFLGWNTNDDGTGTRFYDATAVQDNMTVYAMWALTPYTVTYYVDGVQEGDIQTLTYGAPVTLRPLYAREGHTFSGWSSTDVTLPAPGELFAMPSNSVSIQGKTTPIPYTVTYKVDGAQHGRVDTVPFGTDVAVRNDPTKAGHTFSGWTQETAIAQVTDGRFTMPGGHVVFTGSFTAIPQEPQEPQQPAEPAEPTAVPTAVPTEEPTAAPTEAPEPSAAPTVRPSAPPQQVVTGVTGETTNAMVISPDPLPERELEINGTTYRIKDDTVPLSGIGSRNMGDCPN